VPCPARPKEREHVPIRATQPPRWVPLSGTVRTPPERAYGRPPRAAPLHRGGRVAAGAADRLPCAPHRRLRVLASMSAARATSLPSSARSAARSPSRPPGPVADLYGTRPSPPRRPQRGRYAHIGGAARSPGCSARRQFRRAGPCYCDRIRKRPDRLVKVTAPPDSVVAVKQGSTQIRQHRAAFRRLGAAERLPIRAHGLAERLPIVGRTGPRAQRSAEIINNDAPFPSDYG
jgi:hypothetical protein